MQEALLYLLLWNIWQIQQQCECCDFKYKVQAKVSRDYFVQANLGFAAQYAATNTDPITNLTSHLADPTHINFTTNHVSLPFY
jgi:hypothetical protein